MKSKTVGVIAGLINLFLCQKTLAFDSSIHPLKSNIVFTSFGGKENFGSINYEHIFSKNGKLIWSYSAGVQPFRPAKKFSVPVSINAFTKGRLHHFEMNVAGTFYMDKFHPYNGGWSDDFNKQLYLSVFAGYRLQGSQGLVLKAGVGPQLLLDPPSNDVTGFKTKLLRPSVFAAIGFCF